MRLNDALFIIFCSWIWFIGVVLFLFGLTPTVNAWLRLLFIIAGIGIMFIPAWLEKHWKYF